MLVQEHVVRLRRALDNELDILRRAAQDQDAASMDGALYVLEGLVTDLVRVAGLPGATDHVLPDDGLPRPSPARRGRNPVTWLFYWLLLLTAMFAVVIFLLFTTPAKKGPGVTTDMALSDDGPYGPPDPASDPAAAETTTPVELAGSTASPTSVPPPSPAPARTEVTLGVSRGATSVPASPPLPTPVSTGLDAPFSDLPRHWAARSMAADGDYVGAAGEWERMLGSENPESFTLLIEIDCRTRTLEAQYTLFADDPAAIFKPIRTGGQDCFLLMYGLYATAEEAEADLVRLPPSLLAREEAPLVRRLRHVL